MYLDDVVIIECPTQIELHQCEITEGRLDGEEVLAIRVKVNDEWKSPFALTETTMLYLYAALKTACGNKGLIYE